jgi:hypothetical protein
MFRQFATAPDHQRWCRSRMTNRRNSMTADFRGHTADLLWVGHNHRLSADNFGMF